MVKLRNWWEVMIRVTKIVERKITTEQTLDYLSVALMVAPNLAPRFSVQPAVGENPYTIMALG